MTEEVCVYQYGYSLPADVTQTHTECRLGYTMLCNMLYTLLFTMLHTMLYTMVSNCFTQLCILTFCTQLYTLKQ